MPEIRDLLVEELQGLMDAERQLTMALPKMAEAAHCRKLKEGFEKHLEQTGRHIQRLEEAFEILGETAKPEPCRAMTGLVDSAQEIIEKGADKEELAADLALINAAQKVEHYEIAAYGTAHTLARQIGEYDVAKLLNHTRGEEKTTDYLLTEIAKPLLQKAMSEDLEEEAEEVQV